MIDYGNVNGVIGELWSLMKDLRGLVNEERERRKNPYHPWYTPPTSPVPGEQAPPDISWTTKTTDHT